MADLADVENAIIGVVLDGIYPNGTGSPSVVGATCRIYRGWPTTTGLNSDLAAGVVNITIVPDNDPGTMVPTRDLRWYTQPAAPTLTATVAGNAVTLAGLPDASQLIGLWIDNRTFVISPVPGDSLNVVAASLTAAILQTRPALVSGPVITVPGAKSVVARVVTSGTTHSEVRRQARDIRVVLWCSDPTVRDLAAREVDLRLSKCQFLDLPDESSARLAYKGTVVFDQAQNAQLYRRDLIFTATYPTILSEATPSMLFGSLQLNAIDVVA